jgi:hypothetical protein
MHVTAIGHIDQCRQNIRSTSKNSITSDMENEAVTPVGLGTKTHLVYAVVVDQGQLYTSLTGKFPVRSSKGNWYVMVCYACDCNYVKVVPMTSIYASESKFMTTFIKNSLPRVSNPNFKLWTTRPPRL